MKNSVSGGAAPHLEVACLAAPSCPAPSACPAPRAPASPSWRRRARAAKRTTCDRSRTTRTPFEHSETTVRERRYASACVTTSRCDTSGWSAVSGGSIRASRPSTTLLSCAPYAHGRGARQPAESRASPVARARLACRSGRSLEQRDRKPSADASPPLLLQRARCPTLWT